MAPWLTDEEVVELTGYRRSAHQMKWLAANRIKAYLNALNKVRVSRDAIATLKSSKEDKRTEPDFTKVRKAS
jgi:hypothetical protein